ncbi:MAG: DUF2147 domain-containing protein [Bacteroidetes bacterium]|nr:DUF2147 domain-containing protein [Bacteroidota bacterium]
MNVPAFILCLILFTDHPLLEKKPDAILGKWRNQENTLIVEVYKYNSEFRGKIVWFDQGDQVPMTERMDVHNPDKYLQNRKVLNLVVLTRLVFNPSNNIWENGKIYDCTSGKEWDSSVWLIKDNLLNVRGFWHLSIFGRNMIFTKIP